ncbi:MAG: hypothetical protein CMJ76_17380 [Planctomycetaceae bacterium]|nr:hypothetical protein [Planctomycetaceae bacterium]|tara:strand:+ start:5613 stop:6659 length:1047 start_codon:yes stop_codon:yes gene_type:complete
MSGLLHILPSTSDLDALAQVRILAGNSQRQHTCICLHDQPSNQEQLQGWMGDNVNVYTTHSRSPWIQATQLYRIGMAIRDSHRQGLCWNPGRFSMSSLILFRQIESWDSIITTPSKRELAYPGWAERYVLNNSKKIYVSSEYLKSNHFQTGQVIPPVVQNESTSQPCIDLKKQFELPANATVMLSIGQFKSFSRLKEAIWITGILEHLHENIHLVLCGTGEQLPILKNYRDQMVLRPRIHFLEPWHELTELINQANCLLVTADHSGQDWAIKQAVQLGIPVIASRSDGNQECISHNKNGFIGGPSAGGIAKYLHQLIIDSEVFPKSEPKSNNAECKQQWDSWNALLNQ